MNTCKFSALPVKGLFVFNGDTYTKMTRCKQVAPNVYIGFAELAKKAEEINVMTKRKGRPPKAKTVPFTSVEKVEPLN